MEKYIETAKELQIEAEINIKALEKEAMELKNKEEALMIKVCLFIYFIYIIVIHTE